MGIATAGERGTTGGDRSALRAPLIATAGLLLVSALPRVADHASLAESFWIAAAVLLAWTVVLFRMAKHHHRTLSLEVVLRKPHYVQAVVQFILYAVWGWYWREVYDHAWLIVAQLLFAYAFEALLCWSRRDTWRLGFAPFPIIFSTNLFLWFRDDWFLLQFALVGLGFLGKEFITWQKDGRRAHIFNPSAFSLFVFSLALIVTGMTSQTWAQEIATTLNYPPHVYVLLFVLGLVVQGFFSVTLTTLSAAAALYVLNIAYTQATGVYWFVDSNIPIAVFLGLHLLVTDPATSPRTDLGRVIFGALYGAGVFAIYGILDHLGAPTFYDKLLCVPFLNLAVQRIDRFATATPLTEHRLTTLGLTSDSRRRNLVHMGVWVAFFAWMSGSNFVGDSHVGARPAFWRAACENNLRNGCKRLVRVYLNNCKTGVTESCNEFGVLLAEGRLIPESPELAWDAFTRACDLGSERGCVNAGIQYLYHGRPVNASGASFDILERLGSRCETGSAQSCQLLGYAYESGTGVAPDGRQAETLYRQACDGGRIEGCNGIARLRLSGGRLPVDPDIAAAALETACGLDDASSCRNLALLNHEGRVSGATEDKALALVRRACQLGDEQSCRLATGIGKP